MAAEYATPERLAFMVRYTIGIICVAMDGDRGNRSSPWSPRTTSLICTRNRRDSTTSWTPMKSAHASSRQVEGIG